MEVLSKKKSVSNDLAKQEDVLLCMYGGLPEPPTMNAILVLAQYFRSVVFLRNNLDFPAESYPLAPALKEIGTRIGVQDAAAKGTLWKFARFAKYCMALYRELRAGDYRLVIIHDYLGLLAFWAVGRLAGYKGLSWFNSYDAIDRDNIQFGKYSLMGLVIKYHEQMFAQLDFFSLPAVERMPYYPVNQVKRESFVIPNYPVIRFYEPYYKARNIEHQPVIKMIYQGALGRQHGYEDIIRILHHKVHGKPLQLVLKGWIAEDYKQELIRLAGECGVSDKLVFEKFSLYSSVPQLASTCTIGLAIFTKQDIMNKTLGTASNKIYEYAAVGLPVVLFDTPHFRQYLGDKEWAHFTDLSEASLLEVIGAIMDNYKALSDSAYQYFIAEYNFEKVFTPALFKVMQTMQTQHAGA